MKYYAYAEYIKTNISMLGEIPKTWGMMQVRYLLKDGSDGIKIGPFGSALKLDEMVDSGVRVYGQENVIKKDFKLGKRRISQPRFMEMKVYEVRANDILITMMGTSGKCEIVPENAETGIIDSHLLRLRVKDTKIQSRFFRLLIDECHEIENQIKVSGKGSIMHGLNSSIVKSLKLPLPPIDEQVTILKFLDHETKKIDRLIEKQQQLIKLLQEKRQAVISHAVTKGLNPNAKMKDSGVEWLGEIPEHWGTSRLKYVTNQIIDGAHFTPTYVSEGVPFLRVTDLHNDAIDRNKLKYIPVDEHNELTKRCKPEKGDLLLSKNGTIGITKIIDWEWEFSIFVSLCLIKFKKSKLKAEIFSYIFQSTVIEEQLFHSSKKTSVTNLHLDKIKELYFIIPPIDEQKNIISFLDCETKKIDCLIKRCNKAINLSKERRTALISAAVTGKIDIREAVDG